MLPKDVKEGVAASQESGRIKGVVVRVDDGIDTPKELTCEKTWRLRIGNRFVQASVATSNRTRNSEELSLRLTIVTSKGRARRLTRLIVGRCRARNEISVAPSDVAWVVVVVLHQPASSLPIGACSGRTTSSNSQIDTRTRATQMQFCFLGGG